MKAIDVMNHFREIGTWVNWERTVDSFLHGDPEAEVRGIAVAWIASNAALQEAAEKGLNLFISHEPCFYGRSEERPPAQELARKKRAFMDRHSITLLRCHDTWDRMPEIGIPDAWGDFLGFETEPRPVESFYKICLMEETTVEDAARRILEKVKPLGQDCVMILGDRQKRISRMAIGTGAISNPVMMFALNPDCILIVDDTINTPGNGHWAIDQGIPLLIVSHPVAEYPGMMAMARYLQEKFPGTPVEYLSVAFPYSTIVG
jgi:putative NIF3 family GTP cyclohydrolase 1 type 2